MSNYSHLNVAQYTKCGEDNIFDLETLFCMVNHANAHWSVLCVDMGSSTITSIDSYGTPRPILLRALKRYLNDELRVVYGVNEPSRDWECIDYTPSAELLQKDPCNCGVFALSFVECILNGVDKVAVNASTVANLRSLIKTQLAFGKLMYSP